jgi:hypothetical protein
MPTQNVDVKLISSQALRPQKETPMLPQILLSASAVITLIAGALHLSGTFFDPDLSSPVWD